MEPTTPSPAHPETMDMLSRAWCSFAVQTLSPELHPEKSLALLDTPIKDRSDPFPVSTTFLVFCHLLCFRKIKVINYGIY